MRAAGDRRRVGAVRVDPFRVRVPSGVTSVAPVPTIATITTRRALALLSLLLLPGLLAACGDAKPANDGPEAADRLCNAFMSGQWGSLGTIAQQDAVGEPTATDIGEVMEELSVEEINSAYNVSPNSGGTTAMGPRTVEAFEDVWTTCLPVGVDMGLLPRSTGPEVSVGSAAYEDHFDAYLAAVNEVRADLGKGPRV